MVELISRNDPRYFEQSSYEPYDRHTYRIQYDGGQSITFDNYEVMRSYWFQNARNWQNCIVTVLDVKKEKGFGK
jgi:hypothetical protein